jgi:antitoxin CcdA
MELSLIVSSEYTLSADQLQLRDLIKTDSDVRPRQSQKIHGKLCALIYAHRNPMSSSHTIRRTTPSLPGKRATNLSLSSDVLDAAKQLDINISQVCDNHLREVVRREQERKWREEHADFITAYNATVDAEGLPLDEWKSF